MFQVLSIEVLILLLTSIGIRCQSGEDIPDWPSVSKETDPSYYDYSDRSSCDSETRNALAELKSEVQTLQEILIGLRQKLDPDFKRPPPPGSKCPPGFQYVKPARSCYKVVYEEHNWTAADQRCRGLHPEAHLVAITQKAENIALKAYLRYELARNSDRNVCKLHSWGDPSKMLWTSGQRLNETSCTEPFVWKISNDVQSPLSHTDWNGREPNCYKNEEQCIHLRPSEDFRWNDLKCDHMLCPLCEFDPQ